MIPAPQGKEVGSSWARADKMNDHGCTPRESAATAQVQKRPFICGTMRRASGPSDANADASATLAVHVLERAKDERVVIPPMLARMLAGKSTRRSPRAEATLSPIEARRSSVAMTVPEGMWSTDASMRRMTSSVQAREEQPIPMDRC